MNILKKEIRLSILFKLSFRSSSGSVDRITKLFLSPGQQSIKYLNQINKGNAKVILPHSQKLLLISN